MAFSEKYTTQAKIDADIEGTESKKALLSNDAFAVGEAIELMNLTLLTAVRSLAR